LHASTHARRAWAVGSCVIAALALIVSALAYLDGPTRNLTKSAGNARTIATTTLVGARPAQVWRRVSANAIVHAIIADPHTSTLLFAATTLGVMRSVNGGETWTIENHGQPTVDPAIWAAAFVDGGKKLAVGGDSPHLFLSSDRGQNWSPEPTALGTGGIYCIAVDPHDSRTILAGANDGIWRSADAGTHWSHVYVRSGYSVSALAWVDASSRRVFAGVTPGPRQIVVSDDDGRTWRDADTGLRGGEGIMALQPPVSGSRPESMLAGTMGHRVWRVDLGTLTWSLSAAGLPPGSHGATMLNYAGRTWLGTMGNGIYASADGGRHWAPYGPLLKGFARTVLSLYVTKHAVLAGTAEGIFILPRQSS
jgi:photosystem II stability/assembly factor-like uncharacterized protein